MAINYNSTPKHNWRLRFHLQVPTGNLTDPNGLCQLNGEYHFFHQYKPLWPAKGHGWGGWASRDLLTWEFVGGPIMPDMPLDKDGSYSGSAVIHDGALWCYYTGNVLAEGDYDYDFAGRDANELLSISPDGRTFGKKQLVLGNDGYPSYCSNHVRDPKVWKQGSSWHMLLGARTNSNRGCVLMYGSPDGLKWQLEGTATSTAKTPFGYMWECPNIARLNGREFLFVCPQGAPKRTTSLQNVHDAGYFPLAKGVVETLSGDQGLMDAAGPYACIDQDDFIELDYGFDFYAPQIFEDESGRTILLGWMGLPDIETQYENPTREWAGTFTMPRELSLNEAGRICQWPVHEMDALRREEIPFTAEAAAGATGGVGSARFDAFDLTDAVGASFRGGADIVIEDIAPDARGSLRLNGDLEFTLLESMAELVFTSPAGQFRCLRRMPLSALSAGRIRSLRVIVDSSTVEIYVNGGEVTLSSRWYPENIDLLRVSSTLQGSHRGWQMGSFTFLNCG
ncbi:glycoside hydrolase family 32 protein [Olsenella sp. HMSC062G07]|uniref:glycoside hydrolase family 32 protein n=1 Tax=Olsenella sp. HMSC062G07 TaxID=1739330 RepID=UPI0008A3764A|nr:glycoside hydrolase family 32 protein [Olsenella sp. HMSC062G07]OFK22687.1 sucrose-6-phosphate hydrolase [Olsenella sp. HMSC062G07]